MTGKVGVRCPRCELLWCWCSCDDDDDDELHARQVTLREQQDEARVALLSDETRVLQTALQALEALDVAPRQRVMRYLIERFLGEHE